MRQTKYTIRFIAAVVILVIVTGCGGGSGTRGSISGTVTDAAGNFIPGATVQILEQNRSTKSLFNGVYKIDNVQPDWVNVKATAIINGETWTGIRAANVYSDGPTQSMNIVIGPVTQLGEFRGAVTNASGKPLAGVRVFASAESVEGVTGFEQAFTSMVAFTDSHGSYTLSDVPSRMKINGESVSYDGQPLSDGTPVTPGTYYWVVVASSSANMSGPSYSISELRSVVIR